MSYARLSPLLAPLLCVNLLAMTACDKSSPTQEPTPTPDSPASTNPDNDAAADTAEPRQIAISEARIKQNLENRPDKNKAKGHEVRAQFLSHLKKGRKLVQSKNYKAGIEELDKARALDPNNAVILSEIGFAAMLSDDLALAKEANEASVRFARQDKLKAASLYNLGRVAEKQSDNQAAIDYYRRSLALRPNDTVQKRLAALTDDTTPAAPQRTTCALTKHDAYDLKSLCLEIIPDGAVVDTMCMNPDSNYFVDKKDQLTFKTPNTGFDRVELMWYHTEEDAWTEYFNLVIFDSDGKTTYSTPIAMVYNPGAFGIHEDLDRVTYELEDLTGDGKAELIVRVGHGRYDSDMGIAEFETESTTNILIIGEVDGTPTLLTNIVEKYHYERDNLEFEGEELDPSLKSKDLPITSKFDVNLSFDKKGNLITKASQPGKNGLAAGSYALGSAPLTYCDNTLY